MIVITLTIVNHDLGLVSSIKNLPRQGDRMFVYDLFSKRYPEDVSKIGLNKDTPLIVNSVDWIFTNGRYRIDVKLEF